MPLGEFQLIQRFFQHHDRGGHVVLGVGDDAALVEVPAGFELAVAVDTLVEGVHFPRSAAPGDIGYKALAVNLSDLAAMGAEPVWATLALTLPASDEQWLERFAGGLYDAADAHGVSLIGGDTTRGPLTITVQVGGHVPAGSALRRSGARVGDQIWVSGTLGDAALVLKHELGESLLPGDVYHRLASRLHRPAPRVALGKALREVATAAIDISDGLAADLGHLLTASGVGATLRVERLPLSDAARASLAGEEPWRIALAGGDDYELCFTVPARRGEQVQRLSRETGVAVTRIGLVEEQPGLRGRRENGVAVELEESGYEHFADLGP
ncbi:MAG: thiamine-phosphate kinase [Gammaproteobacteria bacterium]